MGEGRKVRRAYSGGTWYSAKSRGRHRVLVWFGLVWWPAREVSSPSAWWKTSVPTDENQEEKKDDRLGIPGSTQRNTTTDGKCLLENAHNNECTYP